MKLYLKVYLPGGKRIRKRDKWTDKVVYKESFVLYPDKPCDVPDEIAERLLEQDPHLVSKEPMVSASKEPILRAETKVDEEKLKKDAEDKKASKESKTETILRELAEKDFSKLKSTEIIEYGKKLGIEIPFAMKREMKERMLEKRCKELVG